MTKTGENNAKTALNGQLELNTSKCDRATASACCIRKLLALALSPSSKKQPIPQSRPQPKAQDVPARWREPEDKRGTVLYLAYGSNLCHETFQGRRGIKPLADANVLVPALRMTFDLPGIPYVEPCFANSALRDTSDKEDVQALSEKAPLLPSSDYHKDRWKKGLVGVVYECTKEDYAHIIATEGGGSSYQDILVDSYLLSTGEEVPVKPKSKPFKVHTLFAPVRPGDGNKGDGGRFQRPDPSYAQPSARYKKLITDGADEHNLPEEYKKYLHGIRSYAATTKRQKAGQALFVATFFPFIQLLFGLQSMFQDEKGINPPWLAVLMSAFFRLVWICYDVAFKKVFGDGERTIKDSDDEDAAVGRTRTILRRASKSTCLDEEVALKGHI